MIDSIQQWLEEEPDWGGYEDEYLSLEDTAQGAAFNYFLEWDDELLDLLGIVIVEGDRPGSNYCAAELHKSIEEANSIAQSDGIPVRFVAGPPE